MMGIRKKANRWQWSVTIDGKRFWGSEPTVAEAKVARANAITEAAKGAFIAPTRMTLQEYWEQEFLPSIQRARKPGTVDNYTDLYTHRIQPHFGHVRLAAITVGSVNRWLIHLGTKGRADGNGGLGDTSVQHAFVLLSRLLNHAVSTNSLGRNPLLTMQDKPQRSAHKDDRDWWDAPTLGAFLSDPMIRNHRLYPLVALASDTGMRRGELAGLLWTAVDLDAGTVLIKRTRTMNRTYGVTVGAPKSQKGRERFRKVGISPQVVGILQHWHKVQIEERLAAGPNWLGAEEVFTTLQGRAYSPESLSQIWERLRDRWLSQPGRTALPRPSIHELRHSAISIWVANGEDLLMIAERSGHTSVTMLEQVYGHIAPAADQALAARAGNALFGAGS